MKRRHLRPLITAAFAVTAAIVLLRAFAQARKDPSDQGDAGEQQEAIKTPSHVSLQNGKVVIKLSLATQSLAGIAVAPLQSSRERREVTAPAVVLPVQDLVDLSGSYAASQASLHKAENDLNVSRSEYERLKTLFANDQNVSAKAFQTAEGVYHNNQTDVGFARKNLDFQSATLRQVWGDEIAKWVAEDSPILQRVLNRQDVFVQVTLRAGEPSTVPPAISFDLPNQGRAMASLVSAFPRVDPRIQGASFLYKTPARGVLAPGLNLVAHFPFGSRIEGVVIPSSAVVLWQGESWVYEQTAANEFTRQAVPTDNPVAAGFFVPEGFSPGERIVLSGAQTLLSEEFRSQIQPEE